MEKLSTHTGWAGIFRRFVQLSRTMALSILKRSLTSESSL